MTKYSALSKPQMKTRRWKIHPVWRGIGCMMMLIIPIMAYAAANIFVRANLKNHWFVFPPEFTKPIIISTSKIPYVTLPNFNKMLYDALGRIYYGDLAFFVLFLILGYIMLLVMYAFMYQVSAPPRYSGYDIPPIKAKKSRNR
jgi:hypothetical protein